jgi:hypothetical protein
MRKSPGEKTYTYSLSVKITVSNIHILTIPDRNKCHLDPGIREIVYDAILISMMLPAGAKTVNTPDLTGHSACAPHDFHFTKIPSAA